MRPFKHTWWHLVFIAMKQVHEVMTEVSQNEQAGRLMCEGKSVSAQAWLAAICTLTCVLWVLLRGGTQLARYKSSAAVLVTFMVKLQWWKSKLCLFCDFRCDFCKEVISYLLFSGHPGSLWWARGLFWLFSNGQMECKLSEQINDGARWTFLIFCIYTLYTL